MIDRLPFPMIGHANVGAGGVAFVDPLSMKVTLRCNSLCPATMGMIPVKYDQVGRRLIDPERVAEVIEKRKL